MPKVSSEPEKASKKTIIFIAVEILISLAVSAAMIYFVVIPKFNSWSGARTKVKDLESRSDNLDRNINLLKNIDTSEIQQADSLLGKLLPSDTDGLRTVSLIEAVAANSNMKVSAAQLQGSTNTSGTGQVSVQSQNAGKQGASVIKVSFTGSYQSLLNLLLNLNKIDRAVSIDEISTTNDSQSGTTSTISLELPIYSVPPVASADTFVDLTAGEKSSINELLDQVTITINPANAPLGKIDPFN
jgi:Tfp pilus assembly protein PilO